VPTPNLVLSPCVIGKLGPAPHARPRARPLAPRHLPRARPFARWPALELGAAAVQWNARSYHPTAAVQPRRSGGNKAMCPRSAASVHRLDADAPAPIHGPAEGSERNCVRNLDVVVPVGEIPLDVVFWGLTAMQRRAYIPSVERPSGRALRRQQRTEGGRSIRRETGERQDWDRVAAASFAAIVDPGPWAGSRPRARTQFAPPGL
jgi:hypothetical protein